MRQVKEAKDKDTGKLFYFKGHAKATYLSNGTNVEDNITQMSNELGKKANSSGQYDELTVGNAFNLIGRDAPTEEEFVFRLSGGRSIKDGTAKITKLKGNSVVWNLLVHNIFSSSEEITQNNNVHTIYSYSRYFGFEVDMISSHKYLLDVKYYDTSINIMSIFLDNFDFPLTKFSNLKTDTYNSIRKIIDITSNSSVLWFGLGASDQAYAYCKDVQLFDLTKMFGEGNEPTTVEEFNALFPNSYYPYNPGEIITMNANSVKSIGFNAWDGKYEYVNVDWENGDFLVGTSRISNKNLIRVIPNKKYYFSYSDNLSNVIVFYNSEYKRLSNITIDKSSEITIPSNACYIKFGINTTSVSIVNDICINLSDPLLQNGKYEPYQEFIRELPIHKILDPEEKPLFPDGLCSAGDVYDEITSEKAIKRIGEVDLGTLPWEYSTNTNLFYTRSLTSIPLIKVNGRVLNTKYIQYDDSVNLMRGKCINTSKYFYPNALIIADTSFTDAASLKASLSGVYLYYELATPIEVDLSPEINLNYEVYNFGTELMISNKLSTPIKADIIYGFNAVDEIINNRLNIDKIQQDYLVIKNDLINTYATKTELSNYLPSTGGNLKGRSSGSTTISKDLDALIISPTQNRLGLVDNVRPYYPGIAFNHMYGYNNTTTYNDASHAWIGLKLENTMGSERSSLVFAVKKDGQNTDRPIERVRINSQGVVTIGGNVVPSTTNTHTLGDEGLLWKDVKTKKVSIDNSYILYNTTTGCLEIIA